MRGIIATFLLLSLAGSAHGQALGDVARQNRASTKIQAKPAKKIVTNDDIPESPESSPGSSNVAASGEAVQSPASASPVKSAQEWKRAILTQETRVDALQGQIEKLNESIHFVTASAYSHGAEYNQYQVKKQQEVKNLQKQLEEQQKKLNDMQEAARKEGLGDAVYEP